MQYKKLVLRVYPDAILFRDTHHYNSPEYSIRKYIVLYDLPPAFKKKMIGRSYTGDIYLLQNDENPANLYCALQYWHTTPRDAWKHLWMNIVEQVEEKLND